MDANRSGPYPVLFAERHVATSGGNGTLQGVVPLHAGRHRGRIHLTPREREVLALLAEGLSNKLICRQLNISTGTVKIHVARVLAELRASTRLQAVIIAHRLGLLELQAPVTQAAPVSRIDVAGSETPHTAAEPRQIRLGSGK
jgi:DNA-binding CsgD family transcriptional regulator